MFLLWDNILTLSVVQLGLSLAYASVSYTEQLMDWVREFNITVETVEHLLPHLKPRVDNIFYDAKSLVLAFNGESNLIWVNKIVHWSGLYLVHYYYIIIQQVYMFVCLFVLQLSFLSLCSYPLQWLWASWASWYSNISESIAIHCTYSSFA